MSLESIKIGLYRENIQIADLENLAYRLTVDREVQGRNAEFEVLAGPMRFGDEILKRTLVLEIHYQYAEEDHARALPLNGFGSMLFQDYAEAAHEIAEKFCEGEGFRIVNHFNSWPQFQAVVCRQEE